MSLWPDTAAKMLNEQHDVYEKAREEYRKKITEQADRIAQLEAALREADEALTQFVAFEDDCRYIMGNTNYFLMKACYTKVRAALGGENE